MSHRKLQEQIQWPEMEGTQKYSTDKIIQRLQTTSPCPALPPFLPEK